MGWLPKWATSCGSGRRMQAMVNEKACVKALTAPKRRAQSIVHPVSPACTDFTVKRRLQMVVNHNVGPKVHVKVCKKKLGVWCSVGWKTNRDKSYARCCHYVSRRLQKKVAPKPVAPKSTNKCPVNIEGRQCFLNNTNKP